MGKERDGRAGMCTTVVHGDFAADTDELMIEIGTMAYAILDKYCDPNSEEVKSFQNGKAVEISIPEQYKKTNFIRGDHGLLGKKNGTYFKAHVGGGHVSVREYSKYGEQDREKFYPVMRVDTTVGRVEFPQERAEAFFKIYWLLYGVIHKKGPDAEKTVSYEGTMGAEGYWDTRKADGEEDQDGNKPIYLSIKGKTTVDEMKKLGPDELKEWSEYAEKLSTQLHSLSETCKALSEGFLLPEEMVDSLLTYFLNSLNERTRQKAQDYIVRLQAEEDMTEEEALKHAASKSPVWREKLDDAIEQRNNDMAGHKPAKDNVPDLDDEPDPATPVTPTTDASKSIEEQARCFAAKYAGKIWINDFMKNIGSSLPDPFISYHEDLSMTVFEFVDALQMSGVLNPAGMKDRVVRHYQKYYDEAIQKAKEAGCR